MSLEDNVRRQMEEQANAQAKGECPVDGEVDAAFGPSGLLGKRLGKYNRPQTMDRSHKGLSGPGQTASPLGKKKMKGKSKLTR